MGQSLCISARYRRWVGPAGLLLGCGLGGLVPAPAWAQFKPVQGQEYREQVDPKHPVSGRMVVGLSLGGGQPERTLRLLATQAIPPGTALRVEINSPDGRFLGTGVFSGGAAANDWVDLPLLQKDAPLQRPPNLPADELAVSVRAVDTAGRETKWLLPSWQAQPLEQAVLRLQINSRRATMQVLGRDGLRGTCRKARSASAVRFDTVCEIRAADLERLPDGQRRLKLLRRDGFDSEEQVVLLGL